MDNYYYYIEKIITEADKNESLLSASNFFALFAIVLSAAAVYVAYISIFKAKVLDIKFHKFETLCLKNIDSILSPIDEIFQKNQSQPINDFRSQITETVVDLHAFLISMKKSIYTEIDVNELILITEYFTDSIYDSQLLVLNNKELYFSTKLKLYQLLYKHASLNEFRINIRPSF